MNTLTLLPLLLASFLAPPAPRCVLKGTTTGEVRAIATSANGSVVAAATGERSVHTWEVATHKPGPVLKLGAPIYDLAFAPDGRLATLARSLELWNVARGERIKRAAEVNAFQLAYAPDGALAIADHRLDWLDADTLRPGRGASQQSGWLITCIAFSGDGKLVGAGDTAGNLWVWDIATGSLRLRRRGHDKRVTGIGFIDDGHSVVTGGSDGRMKFWSLQTGRELGVVFPYDEPGVLGRGIAALVCTPDGRTIVTGGADDGRIQICEAATAQVRATLTLPNTAITSLALSRDGATLAVGGKRVGAEDFPLTIPSNNGGVPAQDGVVAAWRLYTPASLVTHAARPTFWHELAGDSPTAYQALLWASTQPQAAVALLRRQLRPVKLGPYVRLQCAELIARLDHDHFDEREDAQRQLEALSPWVEPYLKQALAEAKTLELQRRLEAVLAKVSRATLVLRRALEMLEHLPAPEARDLLRQLAEAEPTAAVTQEARHALQRRNND